MKSESVLGKSRKLSEKTKITTGGDDSIKDVGIGKKN